MPLHRHRREEYRLRPIREEDLETVLRWRNSDRIRSNMYTDHIISQEEHRAWFRNLQGDEHSAFLVFECRNRPVGIVSFSGIDRKNGRGNWGFYLGEQDIPKGTGSVLGLLGLEYAFDSLNLRKLCGEAFSFNAASIGFFRRLGFLEEGRFVRHVLKNGMFEDVVSFALFREDWRRDRERLERLAFPER